MCHHHHDSASAQADQGLKLLESWVKLSLSSCKLIFSFSPPPHQWKADIESVRGTSVSCNHVSGGRVTVSTWSSSRRLLWWAEELLVTDPLSICSQVSRTFTLLKRQGWVWWDDRVLMGLLHETDPGNNLEVLAASVYKHKLVKLRWCPNKNYFKEITVILPISSSFKGFTHNCGSNLSHRCCSPVVGFQVERKEKTKQNKNTTPAPPKKKHREMRRLYITFFSFRWFLPWILSLVLTTFCFFLNQL